MYRRDCLDEHQSQTGDNPHMAAAQTRWRWHLATLRRIWSVGMAVIMVAFAVCSAHRRSADTREYATLISNTAGYAGTTGVW
jgi:hypothetical protein